MSLPRNTRAYIKTAQYEFATQYSTRQIGWHGSEVDIFIPVRIPKEANPTLCNVAGKTFYDGWHNESSREQSCAARSDYLGKGIPHRQMVSLSVCRIILVLEVTFPNWSFKHVYLLHLLHLYWRNLWSKKWTWICLSSLVQNYYNHPFSYTLNL